MKKPLVGIGAAAFVFGAAAVIWRIVARKAPKKEAHVRVIMYHSVSDDPKKWSKYAISPQEFESDLRYLSENNLSPVTTADLVAFVANGSPLPENPVMITLDDGYRNNYDEVFPLLKKYGFCATISLTGEFIESAKEDNHNRSFMLWREAVEMYESGLADVANHTWALHRNNGRYGCNKLKEESLEEYKSVLSGDIGALQDKLEQLTGERPAAFVYPYGAVSPESVDVLRELGFAASYSVEQGVNTLRADKDMGQLFGLRRNNRPHGQSSEEFFSEMCN